MAKTKASKKKSQKQTPLMQQYFKVKAKYPDAILLFRVGDFYETFGEDAIKTAEILGIVLTHRNNGGTNVELAGFPYHSVNNYLPKLVRSGYRVAICEQLEKPSKAKKIVKRGVTEVVTPGIAIDDQLLEHNKNNFLASICFENNDYAAVAFLDISTGEFMCSEGNIIHIEQLIQSFQPSELIHAKQQHSFLDRKVQDQYYTFGLDDWVYMSDYGKELLLDHFGVSSLKGFGIEELELGQKAAGAILHYLSSTENKNLQHVNAIRRIHQDKYVWMDRFTIRNLELLNSQHPGGIPLIQILDACVSPMGSRLLKKWLVFPLKSIHEINKRLSIVECLKATKETREILDSNLKMIGDLERLISKVSLGKINPREIVQLKKALSAIEPIKEALNKLDEKSLSHLVEGLNPCKTLQDRIANQIVETPPTLLSKGGVIADGYSTELDEWRSLIKNNKDILLEIQMREAEQTGINNLKIGFNNVFGYYLEVTNKYKNLGLIPDNWIRKQTLTGSERYITEELKELETKILSAEHAIQELETKYYQELVSWIGDYIQPVQHNAFLTAQIDCLLSFAKIAIDHGYNKPLVNDSGIIDIKDARHPVIEQQMGLDEAYVPNDIYLDQDSQQILMITGPNMSGKSAVLRQTALICLMAQLGSYVPASAARIGYIDKLFTRVGASDNISSGESTFMVEMNETASILNNLSKRSLLLLDEIGRGTSTFDGISIAWSIAEYLHEHKRYRAKTLFATHYHELNELAVKFERIKNYNIAVKEHNKKVLFIRKLVPGGSQHSFGIHVAKMAGMPTQIVKRAEIILENLEEKRINVEENDSKKSNRQKLQNLPTNSFQLSFFGIKDEKMAKIINEMNHLDLNSLSPIEALMKLNEWKKLLK